MLLFIQSKAYFLMEIVLLFLSINVMLLYEQAWQDTLHMQELRN